MAYAFVTYVTPAYGSRCATPALTFALTMFDAYGI